MWHSIGVRDVAFGRSEEAAGDGSSIRKTHYA
jgi:hypothetical protein